MQELEWPYRILLVAILCIAGALVFWERAYVGFKNWQLKRAFRRRERADRQVGR